MRWHFLFESLAYIVAFRLYLRARNVSGDFLDSATRWNLIVAAAAGAVAGSKMLYWLEDPARTWAHLHDVFYLMAGKTIVGALLGGTIAVELVKRSSGVRDRTGDLFAIPLAVGIGIGRIGCFLAGIQDDTYGLPSNAPWAIDLGDGIARHPVQLYEIAAMAALAAILARVQPPRFERGDRFRIFVLGYYGWRLAVDFLKPGVHFAGLTMLQWACAAALVWYLPDFVRMLQRKEVLVHG